MRFLVDQNLSSILVDRLAAAGHDAIHVRELGLSRADDDAVMAAAVSDDRVLISADTDLGELLARTNAARPSVLLLRRQPSHRVDLIAGLILANLDAVADDLAAITVAELRYGALVAGWGDQRRQRLEQSIAATTVIPVSDALLTAVAELRHACRQDGNALHEPVHANDQWIGASAVHISAPLLTADVVFDDVPGLTLHR